MVPVLLFPEDVESSTPLSAAVYASAGANDGAATTATLLSEPAGTVVRVLPNVVQSRRVPPTEFADGAPGELIRQAVVGVADNLYAYGQATAYDTAANTVTIATVAGPRTVSRSSVEVVAPAVAILMGKSSIRTNVIDADARDELHHRILDRVLGQNGESATRSVPKLLRGIIPPASHPHPNDTVSWTRMQSGQLSRISVRHVVDFAFYVDGDRHIPPRTRARLGDSFDADPTTQDGPRGNAQAETATESEDEALEALLGALDSTPAQANPPAETDVQLQNQVLAAIAGDPDLVRFYLGQLRGQGVKRAASADISPPRQRRIRIDSPSDLLDLQEVPERSRHTFRPSRVQQAVYTAIASPDHSGKTPVELMDAMISSRSTRFEPHPAILSRLYDFQFGVRGLSLLHFRRFDFTARRRWFAQSNVNLNNFGPSVEMPRPPRPTGLDDLSNALGVLQAFVDEFMDHHTRRLISTAREFIEDIRGYSKWAEADLQTLTFWFDGVLEDYRRATERDLRDGTLSRASTRDQFSFQDPQLQGVLYAIQSERLALLNTHSIVSRASPSSLPPPVHQNTRQGPTSRIPREVLDALPRQGKRTVCMRFLSNAGCFSRQPDRCTAPTRAHFVPQAVPDVVQDATQTLKPNTRQSPLVGFTHIRSILSSRASTWEYRRRQRLTTALLEAGIAPPPALSVPIRDQHGAFDTQLCRALSDLVRRKNLTLEQVIALWRNETTSDPRPNKSLDPEWLDILLADYPHRQQILATVANGVTHTFDNVRVPDMAPVQNHRSAREYATALMRSITDGQRAGTLIVLETSVTTAWKRLRYSPFGMIEKKDVDPKIEGRLIHDLSWPSGGSVNESSTQAVLPPVAFESVRRLALRIEELKMSHPHLTIKMMKGDVKAAFRHIPVAASLAEYFCGSCPHGSVIDLALPFGWTGSPAHYGIFGNAIAFLVARESPATLRPGTEEDEIPFFSYVWVDDHVLIEVDVHNRLQLADSALRLAMLAVLGPTAINDKKFSSWETRLQALGLLWDTKTHQVSMPPDKILKCVQRIQNLLQGRRASKQQLSKLLGSLRHVSLCVRSTRAFIQRLHLTWVRAPLHGTILLHETVIQDLMWVITLLRRGSANNVPTSIIAGTLEPQVHLFMDASNDGLCVLYPAAREFIRLHFDDEERDAIGTTKGNDEFSINVREALSVALAVAVWGPQWKRLALHTPIHVRCWLDNVSAVSWFQRHYSPNILGQELARFVSCGELMFNIHVSTAHLVGASNIMADRGSRSWSEHTEQVPQDLQTQIIKLQWRSLADTSRRQYISTWKQWCRFCTKHGYTRWLPADDTACQSLRLTLFAVDCWRSQESSTPLRFETLRNKISHIGWCHQLVAGFRPQLLPQHELAFKGMQRLSPASTQRHAVTVAMLHKIANALDLSIAQHRVICGAAVLGFFFCLRSSEYLSSSNRIHQYCARVSDITVLDSEGSITTQYHRATAVRLKFRGSKTDQQGLTTTRELLKGNRPPVCPVFAALLLRQTAKRVSRVSDPPLCSIGEGKVLSAQAMTRTLRWAALRVGINESKVSSHSLRIGGATALHNSGASIDTIKMHGRWKSDAYQRYLRMPPPRTLNLTARMDNVEFNNASQSSTPTEYQRATRATTLVSVRRR